MQIIARPDAFDCCDLAAVNLRRQHRAGFDRHSINMNDTSAALAGIAANMCAGQPLMFTDEVDKKQIVGNTCRNLLAI